MSDRFPRTPGPDSHELYVEAMEAKARSELAPARGSAVGGDFYNGIEWLACWLLDNVEGETITEEQMRPWAAEAWKAHLTRHNSVLGDNHPEDDRRP